MQNTYLQNQANSMLPVLKLLDRLDYINRQLLFVGLDINYILKEPAGDIDQLLVQKQYQELKHELNKVLGDIECLTARSTILDIMVVDPVVIPAY